jgi:hypothetical protein
MLGIILMSSATQKDKLFDQIKIAQLISTLMNLVHIKFHRGKYILQETIIFCHKTLIDCEMLTKYYRAKFKGSQNIFGECNSVAVEEGNLSEISP